MDMLDTSSPTELLQGLATTSIHPTLEQPQVDNNICSTSEQDKQSLSLSTTSHLSLKHLKQNTIPSSPETPLLTVPSHFTPTQSPSHSYHSTHTQPTIIQNVTAKGVTSDYASHELPLLQLNNDENTLQHNNSNLLGSGLTQLPIISYRIPGFPLLTLKVPIEEQILPIIPNVPNTNPSSSAPNNLPLLQCPDPNPVVPFQFMPHLPFHSMSRLGPSTVVPSIPSESLPLLVPEEQNPPSLPMLIPIIPTVELQPVHLLPPNVLLKNNPMLSLPHMDYHDTSHLSNELGNQEVTIQTKHQPITTQNPAIVNTVTENRLSTTVQLAVQSHMNTQPSSDDNQLPLIQPRAMEMATHRPKQDDDTQVSVYHAKGTTTDISTQYSPTHTEHTTYIPTHEQLETRQINNKNTEHLSNEPGEDVPELEGTNNQQTTTTNVIPSSESEGCPVDLPSGQTDDNYMKTATPSVHTQRKFIRVIDINTDDKGIPISSSDEESSSVVCELSQIQVWEETTKRKGKLSGEMKVVEGVDGVGEGGDSECMISNVGESEGVSVGGGVGGVVSEGSEVEKLERSEKITDKAQQHSVEP